MVKTWLGILLTLLMGVELSAQVVRNPGWQRRPIRDSNPESLEWGLEAAAHLMRRAGFSASPAELSQIVEQGLETTLDQLINFEQVDDSALELSLAGQNSRWCGPIRTISFALTTMSLSAGGSIRCCTAGANWLKR